jgi:hypothetical protein
MTQRLDQLITTVQHNCHIADARYAGEYSLCIYLLKMREYYRWEHKLPFSAPLENQQVGSWLNQREQLWDNMAKSNYQSLTIETEHDQVSIQMDPLATEPINEHLLESGLVYSGGLGNYCRPLFFLGQLHHRYLENGHQILISSTEYARDLTTPPAMALGKTIFIRRESLRRMLWERLEEWRWHRNEGAMSRALSYYDFDTDLDGALERMTDNETNILLLHELGEINAGEILGEEWEQMLFELPHSRAELMARAVRDHLADCISTLPALLDDLQPPSLHFYFGNFKAMRQHLFPGLMKAYEQWLDNGRPGALQQAVAEGQQHWGRIAQQVLTLFREQGVQCGTSVERLIEASRI